MLTTRTFEELGVQEQGGAGGVDPTLNQGKNVVGSAPPVETPVTDTRGNPVIHKDGAVHSGK